MKPTEALKRGRRDVQKDVEAKRFASALARIDKLLMEQPSAVSLLVLRGRLIQLQDESGPELAEAKQSFVQALELDDQSLEAWLEKAHFEYAVEDSAADAERSFQQAEVIARTALVDALVGRAAALTELERSDEAFQCLTAARWLQTLALPRPVKANSHDAVLDQFELLLGSR